MKWDSPRLEEPVMSADVERAKRDIAGVVLEGIEEMTLREESRKKKRHPSALLYLERPLPGRETPLLKRRGDILREMESKKREREEDKRRASELRSYRKEKEKRAQYYRAKSTLQTRAR